MPNLVNVVCERPLMPIIPSYNYYYSYCTITILWPETSLRLKTVKDEFIN